MFLGFLCLLSRRAIASNFNFYQAWCLVEVRSGLSRVSCCAQLGPLSFGCSEYMQRSPITQLPGIAGYRLSFGTETWWFCDSSVNGSTSYFGGVCMWGATVVTVRTYQWYYLSLRDYTLCSTGKWGCLLLHCSYLLQDCFPQHRAAGISTALVL